MTEFVPPYWIHTMTKGPSGKLNLQVNEPFDNLSGFLKRFGNGTYTILDSDHKEVGQIKIGGN